MENQINSGLNNSILKLALLLSIIGTTNASIAQNFADNNITKTEVLVDEGDPDFEAKPPLKNEIVKDKNLINTLDANNPLVFAEANVGKYYPDMVDYTNNLMNSFWNNEQRKAVTSILSKIVKKYPDPEKRIRFIIGTLEGDVTNTGSTAFSDKYRTDPSEEDMQCYEDFQNEYKIRFDEYEKAFNENLGKLQKNIEKLEQSIKDKEQSIKDKEQSIKDNLFEINKSLENFTIEDIINNQVLYEELKKTKECFRNRGEKGSSHTEELFSMVK